MSVVSADLSSYRDQHFKVLILYLFESNCNFIIIET